MALILLACLFIVGSSAVATADEPVPIPEILVDPDAYHLHVVALQGIVREVRQLEPYFLPSGAACYGAYTFFVEDEEGAMIQISVLGICGPPLPRFPEIADGDKVVVQAEIHAPGHAGRSRALGAVPGPGVDASTVQAVARSIARVAE